MGKKVIVTHHAPDMDAIGAVWLLKQFDSQHYATAKIAFVNPGDTLSPEEAKEYQAQASEITHVDTGYTEFDHHQPDRGQEYISASSLVYDHICHIHPEYSEDKALRFLVDFITEIDHFGEIHWPNAEDIKYSLMIHELIRGIEFFDPHNDDSQLHFGITCLDSAYGVLTQRFKAEELIKTEGERFSLPFGDCLGIETSNDDTIKVAQKHGFMLVVRKDPKLGNIRIKARPDAEITLKPIYDEILKIDTQGSWFYHPSGKMLINGSRKHRDQTPSPLSLAEVITSIKKVFNA